MVKINLIACQCLKQGDLIYQVLEQLCVWWMLSSFLVNSYSSWAAFFTLRRGFLWAYSLENTIPFLLSSMSVFNFRNCLNHRNNTCHKTSITIGVRSGPSFIKIVPLMESSFMMLSEECIHSVIWGNNMELCTKTHNPWYRNIS